jgi:hypothetical protein
MCACVCQCVSVFVCVCVCVWLLRLIEAAPSGVLDCFVFKNRFGNVLKKIPSFSDPSDKVIKLFFSAS